MSYQVFASIPPDATERFVELTPEHLDGVHAKIVRACIERDLCPHEEAQTLFHRPIEAALEVMFRHQERIVIPFGDVTLTVRPMKATIQ